MHAPRSTMQQRASNEHRDGSKYGIALSPIFLATSFICTVVFGFAVGRITQHRLRENETPVPCPSSTPRINLSKSSAFNGNWTSLQVFGKSRLSKWEFDFVEDPNGLGTAPLSGNDHDDDDDDEIYEQGPTGQHLLVDIKGVDGNFLSSEARLLHSFLGLMKESELTLLSYNCREVEPVGVACVGLLLDGTMKLHTWPIAGLITLDIFTSTGGSLMPLLPEILQNFGVPRPVLVSGDTVQEPHMQWSNKRRGFRIAAGGNPEDIDMNQYLLGWMEFDMKKEVATVYSHYQTVQIYDVINPRFKGLGYYERSLGNDGSYESLHPELFQPDRIIYLDSIMQSRFFGEAAYHEALVHPAMVSHPNPRRVAIIGGGEGATLREVLKHNSVETVTMIEIDEIMVNASREHLPQWSDCSNLHGSADSCFDDPRTETFYTDAVTWFIDRYLDESRIVNGSKYDVIIMDALDPSSAVEFSDILYGSHDFVRSLTNALSSDGVFVAQVGEASDLTDKAEEWAPKSNEIRFINLMRDGGLITMTSYTEGHGGFLGVWRFHISFKSRHSMAGFYANHAEVDLLLQRRAMRHKETSETPFRYFDGATMMTYQYPSSLEEILFCRSPGFCNNTRPILAGSNSIMVMPSTVKVLGRFYENKARSKQSWVPFVLHSSRSHDFYGEKALVLEDRAFADWDNWNQTSRDTEGFHHPLNFFNPFVVRNHLHLI